MKKVYLLLYVIVLSLGCRALTPNTDPGPTLGPIVEVNSTDPSQPIEVQAGETFDIFIDSNPTTGYHWEFVSELDENVVEFVSRDYIADKPMKPGSGGVDIFTFKAISAGQAQITLGSYSPDADASEPQQTVIFNIIVN